MLRTLPENLRRLMLTWNDQPVWVDRLWLVGVYALIFSFGVSFGCNMRDRSHEARIREVMVLTEQMAQTSVACVETLNGVTRAAIVLARNERNLIVRRASQ